MSRATITEILPGELATRGGLNESIDSVNAASADIDAVNFAEEGLDRRSVAAGAVVPARGKVAPFTEDGEDRVSYASAALLTVNTRDVVIGPYSFDRTNGEMLRVRASLSVFIENYPVTAIFQLAWSTDYDGTSGTWTRLPSTHQTFRWGNWGIGGWRRYTTAHLFTEPSVITSDNLWFGVLCSSYGDPIDVGCIVLAGTLKAR